MTTTSRKDPTAAASATRSESRLSASHHLSPFPHGSTRRNHPNPTGSYQSKSGQAGSAQLLKFAERGTRTFIAENDEALFPKALRKLVKHQAVEMPE